MLTAPRIGPVVDIATGKAAKVLNARQLMSREALRQWPDLLADKQCRACLLYTSDAADDLQPV